MSMRLSLQKDLTKRWANRVLLYNVVYHNKKLKLKIFFLINDWNKLLDINLYQYTISGILIYNGLNTLYLFYYY